MVKKCIILKYMNKIPHQYCSLIKNNNLLSNNEILNQ